MVKRYFLLTFLFVHSLLFLPVNGQIHSELPKKWQNIFQEAILDYQQFSYNSSLKSLDRIIDKYPQYYAAYLLQAQCYRELGNMKAALASTRNAYRLAGAESSSVGIEYIDLLMHFGKYREAQQVMERLTDATPIEDSKSELLHTWYEKIQFALKIKAESDSSACLIPLKGLDPESSQYFPALTGDGLQLIFTQNRFDTVLQVPGQEDLYAALLIQDSVSNITKFPSTINTDGNDGTQTIRQDGRLMLFTSCSRADSKGGCDIYVALKSGGSWAVPQNIGYPINTRYWESAPSLSPDGTLLLFSSNRPGGYGGMDLWMSKLVPGSGWSEPVNLGDHINTNKNEMAPFWQLDGKRIYFASDGLLGLGGFDLFRSNYQGAKFENPVNLGYPINTFNNEFGFAMPRKGDMALFSSDRESEFGRKLYLVELPLHLQAPALTDLSGIVTDSVSGKPLGAGINVVDGKGVVIQTVDSDPTNGSFQISLPGQGQYTFVVNKAGYLYYAKAYHVLESDDSSAFFVQVQLQPLERGANWILNHLYFDFDSAEIQERSVVELTNLLNLLEANPAISIEISGHTDSIGNHKYNLELSEMRAQAVVNYLVSNGIQEDRLSAIGLGSNQPISSNETDEGRQKNRRTEVKIL